MVCQSLEDSLRIDLETLAAVNFRIEVQKRREVPGNGDQENSGAPSKFGGNPFVLEGQVYGPNGRIVSLRTETAYTHLKQYVRDLLWQQGIAQKEMTREEAESALAEEGDWAPEKVAQRILDFARRLASDDPAMLTRLREATVKGFDEAKRIFGGWLPELSEQTFEQVTKGFESLEKHFAS